MVKLIVYAPWVILLVVARAHGSPMIIQPYPDDSQDDPSTGTQNDGMDFDGVVDIMRTEAALFASRRTPVSREAVERLQQYASDLDGIDVMFQIKEHPSHENSWSSSHSIVASLMKGMETALAFLHGASARLSSVRNKYSSTHQNPTPVPEIVVKIGGLDDDKIHYAFQDEGEYSVDDLTLTPPVDMDQFNIIERVIESVVGSHHQSSSVEPEEEELVDASMDEEEVEPFEGFSGAANYVILV
ncbi:hypothetical protein M408DRAFT_255832 [Serendipita vermifera MAFF 305830]|uniref:Uncharacterized protein n=1 Tax=Serendipita vermifera MAFF 305830 TaxID=933852 RepID=A0A0C3BGF7_SERVB|nr:hypothetical protein M408DRAFT_255832 [Serendipita vermifera MAFF 305830]